MLSSLHPFFWPAHVFQTQNEIHCVNNCDVLHSVISETKLGWSGDALLMWHMYYFLTVLLTFFVLSSLPDLVLFTLPYLIHFSLVVLPVWFHTICSFIHFWKWNTNTTACCSNNPFQPFLCSNSSKNDGKGLLNCLPLPSWLSHSLQAVGCSSTWSLKMLRSQGCGRSWGSHTAQQQVHLSLARLRHHKVPLFPEDLNHTLK